MSKKRTCETCEKVNAYTGDCKVLKENIKGECWAWTDIVNWEMYVLEAVERYKEGKRA